MIDRQKAGPLAAGLACGSCAPAVQRNGAEMRRVESCYYFITYNHRLYSKAQTGSSPTSRRSRQLSPTLNRAPVLTAIKDCAIAAAELHTVCMTALKVC